MAIPKPHPFLTRKDAIHIIARVCGVSYDDLVSPMRLTELVRTRYAAVLLLPEFFPTISLQRMGTALGRDHTTILTGRRRALRMLEADQRFSALVSRCRCAILSWKPENAARMVTEADLASVATHVAPAPQIAATASRQERVTPLPIGRPVERWGNALAVGDDHVLSRSWWAENDRRVMRAFAAAHPELLPPQMREAAE